MPSPSPSSFTPAERLADLLDWLEAVVDERRLAEIDTRHCRALAWESVDRLPLVLSHPAPAEGARFRPWPMREIYDDPAKMLFNELVHAFDTSLVENQGIGADLAWTVRANFGTVVIASLFGASVEQVEDNPPWAHAAEDSLGLLRSLASADPEDFSKGWCPRVIERYAWYREALAPYPRLSRAVRLILPDMQGPFDTLEMLIGGEAFLALHEEPEAVGAALRTLARAQVAFARCLASAVSDGPDGYAHQHATAIRGRILLRDDTSIMIAPAQYRELVAPHDAHVLEALGGGGIHSCGNVGRHAPEYFDVPGLQCFDFGQAEMNDVDRLYALAAPKRIGLVRVWASEEELTTGSILKRFPTGVSLRHRAASVADARRIMDAYLKASENAPRA